MKEVPSHSTCAETVTSGFAYAFIWLLDLHMHILTLFPMCSLNVTSLNSFAEKNCPNIFQHPFMISLLRVNYYQMFVKQITKISDMVAKRILTIFDQETKEQNHRSELLSWKLISYPVNIETLKIYLLTSTFSKTNPQFLPHSIFLIHVGCNPTGCCLCHT